MDLLEFLKGLTQKNEKKIVLVVVDGLGGIPGPEGTELELANTPNLDRVAKEGACGLMDPVFPGITPGSGPGHFALFGYDPVKYQVGRGVLSALGIDFPLKPGDVAARVNFATVDEKGVVIDRRAGRIPTELNRELCEELEKKIDIPGIEVFIRTEREHRACLVLRGEELRSEVSDTDPQKEGFPPLEPKPLVPEAERTVSIIKEFLKQARDILSSKKPANMLLLRGFSSLPKMSSFGEVYKLTPACIAVYPMYKGLARLVGMEILKTGETVEDEVNTLKENYDNFDFFFLHYKATDSAGEDGNSEKKIKAIETLDKNLPSILALEPDVLCITADHSTPTQLKAHSWHPVPVVIRARTCFRDDVQRFSEWDCLHGILGKFPALYLMPLLLAHALKLKKFGA
ncbi:MAG TPA: 2,3-bisphosphoglycerate-independent phosphoglycerate mutase [bacterium]|nr:2,3-bisphosphoglycerate-independent phosphoglycerate mutase [bacterium]HEX67653.1 2,3-bisphosphoglycerate-independent phosphoglycerate mutase [bacterium]